MVRGEAVARHQAIREHLDRIEVQLQHANVELARLSVRLELEDRRSSKTGSAYKPQPNDTWDNY